MSRAALAAERVAALAVALEAARRRMRGPFVGKVELYCDNVDCPAREVSVTLKEYDGPCGARARCPICRAPLKLHHVQTLAEAEEKRRRDSRACVNVQLYIVRERRRLGDPRALVAVPLRVALDDSLPGVVG